jgi:hypothetical protein
VIVSLFQERLMCLHTIKPCFMLFFIALFFQISDSGQRLRYQFKQGKTYSYSTRIDTKTSGQMMGQEFIISSDVDFDYSMRVIHMSENRYTMQATFEKYDVNLHIPILGFNDSTVIMKEYVGKRMIVLMTDRGKILSIEQVDSLPPCRIQFIANLSPLNIFRKLIFELPEEAMDMNGSWKNKNPDAVTQGNLTIVTQQDVEFKIVGAEKKNSYDCWKILITGSSTLEGSGSQGANTVTVDGIIKNHGSVFIAPVDGVFVSAEQTVENELTTTITGQETGASTMIVNTSIRSLLVN